MLIQELQYTLLDRAMHVRRAIIDMIRTAIFIEA